MVARLEQFLNRQWYQGGFLSTALRPLGALYCAASYLRHQFYTHGRRQRAALPSLVVGNLTVGGSGKTPLVLALAQHLVAKGWHPALVSRGYRARPPAYPYLVQKDDDPIRAGDEPLLLSRRSQLPVVIGPDRLQDIAWLSTQGMADIVILDDGFQHLSLLPDLSLLVVDGLRGFGVGRCLPAGPLREPLMALHRADALITNGVWTGDSSISKAGLPLFEMQMQAQPLVSIEDSEIRKDLSTLQGQLVHAVSGIGNPERFFRQLEALGAIVQRHPFPDHHVFEKDDFRNLGDAPIVMTEKDAVKCAGLNLANAWVLRIEAVLDSAFWCWFDERLDRIRRMQDGH